MKYMEQLDALRGISVIAVLYHHFYGPHATPLFIKTIQWGGKGVDLFYVLSGFLITSILLHSRHQVENGRFNAFAAFKVFYIRRCLRIFPIYYLTLVAVSFFLIVSVKDSFFWHSLYLSNFHLAMTGTSSVPHFWSLSVEEQFYLIWPWVIFLTPRKYLLGVIALTITISPLYRFIVEQFFNTNIWWSIVVTLANLDLLGFGALLALVKHDRCYSQTYNQISRLGLIVGGTFFLGFELLKCLDMTTPLFIFRRTMEGFFFVWLVDKVSDGIGGIPGAILNLKPLVYLGKISYGVYLYHFFMPTIIHEYKIPAPSTPALQALVYSALALIISIASWVIIESPVNKLKSRFNY